MTADSGSRGDIRASSRARSELESALEAHGEWLRSGGSQGERLEYRNHDLSGVDLKDRDLRRAVLTDCRLIETDLRCCQLDYADLRGVTGLLPRQVAGADLTGCELPESVDLQAPLKQVNDHVLSARKTLLAMVLALGYLWLTIGTTSDVDLLTNSAASPLPIINTPISFAAFFLAAPSLLLAIYLYFHIQQQRLWETLVELPARFPDGRSLDQHTLPWVMTGLIHAHSPRLQVGRPPMSRLQNALAIGLVWYAVPVSLAAVWLRFAPRHDGLGTLLQGSLLAISIIAAVLFYNQTLASLGIRTHHRGNRRLLAIAGNRPALAATELAALGAAVILVPLLSWGMMTPRAVTAAAGAANPQTWVPVLLDALGYRVAADFRDMDVSVRPANWSDVDPPLDRVQGANLRNVNLRRADAVRAFLVGAQLQGADLAGADLEAADLRGARLIEANLTGTSLLLARMQETDLSDANLDGAQLIGADLSHASLVRARLTKVYLNRARLNGATLAQADLSGALLHDAVLNGTNLDRAIFAGTGLEGVDLRGALGLSCAQIRQARIDDATRLPTHLNCE